MIVNEFKATNIVVIQKEHIDRDMIISHNKLSMSKDTFHALIQNLINEGILTEKVVLGMLEQFHTF